MGTGKNTPSAGQRRAMEAGDRNLLVSAAAGSVDLWRARIGSSE